MVLLARLALQESRAGGILEHLAHTLAGLSRALEVLFRTDPLGDLCSLEKKKKIGVMLAIAQDNVSKEENEGWHEVGWGHVVTNSAPLQERRVAGRSGEALRSLLGHDGDPSCNQQG